MTLGLDIGKHQLLTFGHDGQLGLSLSVLSVALFISAFFIGIEEAAEGNDGTAGGEFDCVT